MTREPHGSLPPLRIVGGSERAAEPMEGSSRGTDRGQPKIRDVDWTILMGRAQAGDADAYLRLLHEITPYLRTLAARRHCDAAEVEDAVQDVLLTIHAIRHTYDPARPFGPWLVAIANRRFMDRLRRQGRRQSRETPLGPEHETFAEAPANLELKAEGHGLQEAIDNLPPMQKQAIEMLKLREMSLKEAAAASGLSIAALKVATHRAIRSLRRRLGDRSDRNER